MVSNADEINYTVSDVSTDLHVNFSSEGQRAMSLKFNHFYEFTTTHTYIRHNFLISRGLFFSNFCADTYTHRHINATKNNICFI